MTSTIVSFRLRSAAILLAACCWQGHGLCLFAQESGQEPAETQEAADEKGEADNETEKEAAEEDPYAVPEDATVEELLSFIDSMKRVRPSKEGSMAATAKKVFPAILRAADQIIEKTDQSEQVTRAIKDKFYALRILQRYDPSAKQTLLSLAEDYADNENPEIAVAATGALLNDKASGARTLSSEQSQELADESIAFLEKFGVDRTTYGTVSSIARNMGYGEHTEIAANLYERMAPLFRDAEDESFAARADTMLGAARRLRLLGNTMDVFGTTAEGEEFNWDDYKGKVVLVDFWASWCGPCLGELPNMKKNLKLYGDRGFEIVGINMDDSRERFENCVEDKEISWVNIVSEEEGQTGWQAPMAIHYGITGIPTAILVNKEGKVVSLRARGRELDSLLAELLGPPETEGDASEDDEAAEKEAAEEIKD